MVVDSRAFGREENQMLYDAQPCSAPRFYSPVDVYLVHMNPSNINLSTPLELL